jgi:Transposase DDE domain
MLGRSTFYERYRRVHRLFREAIRLQGREAVQRGWADAECVAVDKSLIEGQGRPWSPQDRACGYVPRGVDQYTTWGYSKYDGWVQGYAFEVVVTAPRQGIIWPLLASVDTASRSEQKTFLEKIADLPRRTKFVLADSGYDSNRLGEAVEWYEEQRTGRRFLCPEVRRPNTGQPRQAQSRQSRARQDHRRLRDGRKRFLQSRRGRSLYARRKVCAEPFHAHLKHLFDLDERVWHRGLDNNRTMISAAICAYQLLLMHNFSKGNRTANLQRLLDAL